jgi:crotonobetainyl-CoA hydratase
MSDSAAQVGVERRGAVLEVTIDRPKANAIDGPTSRRLGEVFASFRDDADLRVALVTGAGERFFSAGWDLKALAVAGEPDLDFGVGGFAGLQELPGLNKPVIAAVNGMAAGGGFELALAADLVVAVEGAEFTLPELGHGILPDAAAIKLPRRVPYHLALDLLLTGRRMPAEEAQRWGIVRDVVPRDALMDTARGLADELATLPPRAVAATKEVVRETSNLTVQEAFDVVNAAGLPALSELAAGDDLVRGAREFARKRAS